MKREEYLEWLAIPDDSEFIRAARNYLAKTIRAARSLRFKKYEDTNIPLRETAIGWQRYGWLCADVEPILLSRWSHVCRKCGAYCFEEMLEKGDGSMLVSKPDYDRENPIEPTCVGPWGGPSSHDWRSLCK